MSTELTHRLTPEDEELARKQAELAEIEAELADGELELATLAAQINRFGLRYLAELGPLFAELDDLNAQILEAVFARAPDDQDTEEAVTEARERARESAEAAADADEEMVSAPSFTPSEDLKKLYRDVAKAVHPDLAADDAQRERRTRLMAEANQAYAEGDEERLRTILRDWESSPESVAGNGTGAELVRTIRKIAQVRARLDAIGPEMEALREGPMYVLMMQVSEAEGEGRDLLAEMAAALRSQIEEARERLREVSAGE